MKVIFILFYFISLLLINFITDSMKLDFVALFSDCSLLYIYIYIYVLCCSVKVCDTFLQKIYLPFCMADKFGCVINLYFSSSCKMHALPCFSLSLIKKPHLVFFITHL